MREHSFVAIDGNKLNAEIAKRGLVKEKMAFDLGYSKTFIQHLIAEQKARPVVIDALDRLFEIKLEDIKPDEPQEDAVDEAEAENENNVGIHVDQEIWDKLSLVVYAAVKKAVTDALNE